MKHHSKWKFYIEADKEEAVVKHLPRTHSDHCPVLVLCKSMENVDIVRRPFRFQSMWLTHPMMEELVTRQWNSSEGDVLKKEEKVMKSLQVWNREVSRCSNDSW